MYSIYRPVTFNTFQKQIIDLRLFVTQVVDSYFDNIFNANVVLNYI